MAPLYKSLIDWLIENSNEIWYIVFWIKLLQNHVNVFHLSGVIARSPTGHFSYETFRQGTLRLLFGHFAYKIL